MRLIEYRDTGYYVKRDGTIIGKYGRPLKPRLRGDYLSIRIHNGDRTKGNTQIHLMVAECYLGKKPKGLVVNHKDGNKQNNHIDNLEYITQSQNSLHAVKLGLIKTKITNDKLMKEYNNGLNCNQIAKKYNMSKATLYKRIKRLINANT